jgi:16S rRNA (cytidine1402-2'-O)-methyltransferase
VNGADRDRRSTGRLLLMPNTLDLGTDAVPITDVLADGVLRQAAALTHWVAEDPKSARAFLKRVAAAHPLAAPLQALHIAELPRPRKGSREGVARADWQALLQPALQGHDIGLISEAGLPGVADPGAALVQEAHAAGVEVLALPGPSSLLLALAASGLNGQHFAFVGYLPQDAAARQARIVEIEATSRRTGQAQIVIETPYRNAALLQALLQALAPQTRLSVSCGLTLPGGFSRSDHVAGWRQRMAADAVETALPDRFPAVFCLQAG